MIDNLTPLPTTMDGREYDRIADLLAQIYSKYNNMKMKTHHASNIVQPMRNEMQEILERALVLNDFMGKLEEKGLI
jgi:regulator of sirC expression with transglutaminase-like and TPR domain